jgi:hypothetical protein
MRQLCELESQWAHLPCPHLTLFSFWPWMEIGFLKSEARSSSSLGFSPARHCLVLFAAVYEMSALVYTWVPFYLEHCNSGCLSQCTQGLGDINWICVVWGVLFSLCINLAGVWIFSGLLTPLLGVPSVECDHGWHASLWIVHGTCWLWCMRPSLAMVRDFSMKAEGQWVAHTYNPSKTGGRD